MHFPYISSTLPRKWKIGSGQTAPAAQANGKPPKSSSRKAAGQGSRPRRSASLLCRSASFSDKKSSQTPDDVEFRVPLPPPPLPPISFTSVPIQVNCGQSPRRLPRLEGIGQPPTASISSFQRSQSMVDLVNQSKRRSLLSEVSSSAKVTPQSLHLSCEALSQKKASHGHTPQPELASISTKNLRSNSWRNLTQVGRMEGKAIKVAPPMVPPALQVLPQVRLQPQQPQNNGLMARSDWMKSSNSVCLPVSTLPNVASITANASRHPSHSRPPLPELFNGRDSPISDESSCSITTLGSSGIGCTTNSLSSMSLNSGGRASSSEATPPPYPPRPQFLQNKSSNVRTIMSQACPENQMLYSWLRRIGLDEYYPLLISAGYDLPSIARMTPEDMTAIGIQKPHHRKVLKNEISKLDMFDSLPNFIPEDLDEWLYLIGLPEYAASLKSQGILSVPDAAHINVEDLEDVGLIKLGHQKRFLLAARKVRDLQLRRNTAAPLPERKLSLMSTFQSQWMRNPALKQNNVSSFRPLLTTSRSHEDKVNCNASPSPPASPSSDMSSMPDPMAPLGCSLSIRMPEPPQHSCQPPGNSSWMRNFDQIMNKPFVMNGHSDSMKQRPVAKIAANPCNPLRCGGGGGNGGGLDEDPALVKAHLSQHKTSSSHSPSRPAEDKEPNDVLRDIGAMLAHLTDELDSMLQMETVMKKHH